MCLSGVSTSTARSSRAVIASVFIIYTIFLKKKRHLRVCSVRLLWFFKARTHCAVRLSCCSRFRITRHARRRCAPHHTFITCRRAQTNPTHTNTLEKILTCTQRQENSVHSGSLVKERAYRKQTPYVRVCRVKAEQCVYSPTTPNAPHTLPDRHNTHVRPPHSGPSAICLFISLGLLCMQVRFQVAHVLYTHTQTHY